MILIQSGGPYKLLSEGNGASYLLQNWGNEDKPETPWEVFFQGDDALLFEQDLKALEDSHPTMPTRDVLGELWAAHWTGEQ